MHDYSYSAHLVINDGYEDRLDMKISCQNAQQLLRARDNFSDQMNTYICLLYTSDAADEEDSVDLAGRRLLKKKKKKDTDNEHYG